MLYITAENIPAGHYVIHPDPRSQIVMGRDPVVQSVAGLIVVTIGIARENLREGFRVCVRDDGVYEDDA